MASQRERAEKYFTENFSKLSTIELMTEFAALQIEECAKIADEEDDLDNWGKGAGRAADRIRALAVETEVQHG